MPPESGISPILQKAWMKLADCAATTMSHASAMFAPAPAATPFTAHTTGSGSLRKREDQRPVVVLDGLAEVDRRAARRDRAVGQVLAGAEAAPGAGQQQHARPTVGLDPRERIAQFRVHRRGEAVEPVGTVERDARDAAGVFEEDRFVGHCLFLATSTTQNTSLDFRSNVHPMLHDAEAVRDVGGVGQRRIGRRIGARAVEVGERRRLVDEHARR